MQLILLGPNGQLGRDLTAAAAAAGGGPGGGPGLAITPIERGELDVTDVEAITRVLGGRDFDVLVNCASYHKTDEVESNAQQAVAVNAHAVKAMAQACRAKGARLVHVSTDYVFDGRGDRPYVETDVVGPLNVYGATKAMGESLARAAHDDVVILRVASLFGVAGASGKGGNFVETMIRVGRERGALRVVEDQRMSPTATADVAAAIVKALAQGIPAGTYHCVNGGNASWYEFASRIIERAGVEATVAPIPTSEYPTPAQRPAYSVLDGGKLSALIGAMPPWEDALDRYLAVKAHG